jgi:hypothetical protein
MRRATHIGSCQCCGRVQKLPSNLLSLHGYTKQWGWFMGTCRGSGYKPFEISKDLIERFIAESERAIEGLKSEKAALLKPPTKATKAWLHVYVYRGGGHSVYEPQQGMVRWATQVIGGKAFKYMQWQGDTPVRKNRHGREEPNVERVSIYDLKENTTLAATASLNANHVRSSIDTAIANHQKYIAWQRERIANWKPQPLAPVFTEADRQKEDDTAALIAAGCTRRPHGWAGTMFWFCPKGKWCLGRTAKAAVAELKKIEEKAK